MELEKRLKQLNNLQLHPDHARAARARFMASVPPQLPKLTWRTFLTGVLQSGSAMALTGLFLFIAIGGFSLWKVLGPVIGLDPRALHVEAQAIDIQIHLADLQYKDGASGRPALIAPNSSIKTAAVAPGLSASTPSDVSTTSSSGFAWSEDSTSTASSTSVGVSQVLKILSQ